MLPIIVNAVIWLEAETVVHVESFIHTEHVALKHILTQLMY